MGPRRYFSSKEVLKFTGVSYRQLDAWVRAGIIRASGLKAAGKGTRRKFTFVDMVEVKALNVFCQHGMRLSKLTQMVIELRKQLNEMDEHVIARSRLVTNGTTVFRLLSDKGTMESLDGCGQLAFAFGVGAEVGELIERVKQSGKPIRYERRIQRAA
jgi:DNA-binding transcriptional MerR regulator